MATIASSKLKNSLLHRLLDPWGGRLSVSAAKSLLDIKFSETDHARMEDLCTKNNGSMLSNSEQEELDEYERVGCLLDVLHSKARLALSKRRTAS